MRLLIANLLVVMVVVTMVSVVTVLVMLFVVNVRVVLSMMLSVVGVHVDDVFLLILLLTVCLFLGEAWQVEAEHC